MFKSPVRLEEWIALDAALAVQSGVVDADDNDAADAFDARDNDGSEDSEQGRPAGDENNEAGDSWGQTGFAPFGEFSLFSNPRDALAPDFPNPILSDVDIGVGGRNEVGEFFIDPNSYTGYDDHVLQGIFNSGEQIHCEVSIYDPPGFDGKITASITEDTDVPGRYRITLSLDADDPAVLALLPNIGDDIDLAGSFRFWADGSPETSFSTREADQPFSLLITITESDPAPVDPPPVDPPPVDPPPVDPPPVDPPPVDPPPVDPPGLSEPGVPTSPFVPTLPEVPQLTPPGFGVDADLTADGVGRWDGTRYEEPEWIEDGSPAAPGPRGFGELDELEDLNDIAMAVESAQRQLGNLELSLSHLKDNTVETISALGSEALGEVKAVLDLGQERLETLTGEFFNLLGIAKNYAEADLSLRDGIMLEGIQDGVTRAIETGGQAAGLAAAVDAVSGLLRYAENIAPSTVSGVFGTNLSAAIQTWRDNADRLDRADLEMETHQARQGEVEERF